MLLAVTLRDMGVTLMRAILESPLRGVGGYGIRPYYLVSSKT